MTETSKPEELDFASASQALAGIEHLDVPAMELMYKLECSGEDFYNALADRIGNDEAAPKASGLVAAGEWTSMREREAMSIERDADDVARCFLLERELFEHGWDHVFGGEVVGLAPVGAFVGFGDGHEGLLPVRRLRGDWWELNEEGTILFGERTGATLRLGDPVRVRVRSIDAPRGRVDLDPAEDLVER